MTKREEEKAMEEYQSLAHARCDCKYHIVFIPKRGKKKLVLGALRQHLGSIPGVGLHK